MNIYVGNLPLNMTADELWREFASFGKVVSVTIMNDKYIGSGQTRGYGFVEMPSHSEALAAVSALNGKRLPFGTITVIQALPLSSRGGAASCGSGTVSPLAEGRRAGRHNRTVRQRTG